MAINAECKEGIYTKLTWRPILTLVLALICLSACGGGDAAEIEQPSTGDSQVVGSSSYDVEGEIVEPVGDDAIQILWQASAHAATYVLDEAEQNSTCARCHAPANWIPSMDDMPESCLACKFEVDPPAPFIPENEWAHIECKICHEYKKDEIQPGIAWLEIAAIGDYAEIESVTALCDKCHLAGDIASHASVVVGGDHAGYTCAECHDPHNATASCGAEGCHPTTSEGIVGHDPDHANVTCAACHDGAQWAVGILEESAQWVTFLPGSELSFVSHVIQKAVECDRCHFSGNPWGLSQEVQP